LIEWGHPEISVNRQCELLNLSKGGLYYEPAPETEFNLMIMEMIDKQYLETPFYGSRRMEAILNRAGHLVNRKRVQRLMNLMGIEAIYPKPNLSKRRLEHKVYPYLLKGLKITRPNFVWSTDITYIRMKSGFLYLVAVIDWFSRYVLAWRLSNSLTADFCLEAVEEAISQTEQKPEIFNTDQGCQFTANEFVALIQGVGIKMSMDGRGRALDNIFIERLWRSLKYEEVYLRDYQEVSDVYKSMNYYFDLYNNRRPHQSLKYKYPREVHYGRC
jgi:putative transposase